MNQLLQSPAFTADDLQIEVIRSEERWEEFGEVWNAMAAGRPLQRYEWLRGWWTGYGAGRELRIVRIFDDRHANRGFLPLCKGQTATGGRQLALLGSGKACSDDQTLLLEDVESASAVAGRCVRWLAEAAAQDPWDVLELEGISPHDAAVSSLLRQLAESGFSTATHEDQSCWRTELGCDWETLLERLTKRARRLLRTHMQRFEQSENEFLVAETAEQRDAFFDSIAAFHQMRWADLGIDGCFSTDQFRAFLQDAVARLWHSGRATVTQVKRQGEPISGSIGILSENVHSVYLVGNHPQYAELQPGWSLNAALLRSACDRGLAAVDFLRGDEAYKARLGAQPRSQVRCTVYGQNVRAKAEQGLLLVKSALHKIVDSVRS